MLLKVSRSKDTSMWAHKLGGGYGGGVVLPYHHPKLLHLALRHQPGLMNPLGRHILQLRYPGLDVFALFIIVLQIMQAKCCQWVT